jgi:hypothetical protein
MMFTWNTPILPVSYRDRMTRKKLEIGKDMFSRKAPLLGEIAIAP